MREEFTKILSQYNSNQNPSIPSFNKFHDEFKIIFELILDVLKESTFIEKLFGVGSDPNKSIWE